jgi:hypothetical protein
MPLAIVATAGAANANSFATAAEMSAYCDARLNATIWTGADAQLPALVEATRELTVLEYVGTRVDTTQALAWPRDYAINPDLPSVEYLGDIELLYFATTIVPQRVKDAACELALQYLKAGSSDLAVADANQGVIEKTVGPLTTKWGSPASRAVGMARFARVLDLLDPLLSNRGVGLTLVRV